MLEFIDGNEAVVRGALDAGCNFFAGYPITPASSICMRLAQEIPKQGGICIQAEDEIASIGFCIAASVAGKKAMTASSGPGLSLYSENIGLAIMGEVPLVIVISQRQGPATGSATDGADGDLQFVRWVTSGGLPIIALMPATVSQCYTFTIRCFNLAEEFRTPVFLLINKELSMSREVVDWSKVERPKVVNRKLAAPQERFNFQPYFFEDVSEVPFFYPFGQDVRIRFTTSSHNQAGELVKDPIIIDKMVKHFSWKIMKNADRICYVEKDLQDGADILVISLGISSRATKEAIASLREKGLKVSHLIIYSIWPSPGEEILACSKNVNKIVVVEWNLGQYILEIQRLVKNKEIVGVHRMDTTLITPEQILEAIQR